MKEVFSRLNIEPSLPDLGEEWEMSQKTFPGKLSFLHPQFIRFAAQKYLPDTGHLDELVAAARRISQNPDALRFMWHQHYLVVQNYDRFYLKCYKFPELHVLGEDARSYYLLLAFSGVEYFGDVHQKLGIPKGKLGPAIRDFQISVEGSMEKTGHVGLAPHYSGWWQGLFSAKLFRLGRLTFVFEHYRFNGARVYENIATKEVRVFSEAGIDYNSRGLVALKPSEKSWRSSLKELDDVLRANPIASDGYASSRVETISLKDWQRLARAGDRTVGVHISPGEPMGIKECIDSFAQLIEFLRIYFPKDQFRMFTIASWLLDPNLAEIMKPESNIVQFQKRFYQIPSPNDFEFVSIRQIFGAEALKVGIENVALKTGLQKAAAEFKRNGGEFRDGFGIYPFKAWGDLVHGADRSS
jgi:hypothetical protein